MDRRLSRAGSSGASRRRLYGVPRVDLDRRGLDRGVEGPLERRPTITQRLFTAAAAQSVDGFRSGVSCA